MKRNMRIIVIVITVGIIISSMVFLMKYNPLDNIQTGYLLDKKIPGIVKGTAKMVDTEAYFTKYELQESSVRLDFICNNSNNLQIAIGYKSPTTPLMLADYPTKEIVIWSGEDNLPESSNYYKTEIEEVSRITKEWDLLSIGFTEEEYVKADERIWYLRINDLSNGPYGYEKNVTEVIDGTEYLIPEFIPNIHYVEEFKLVFNQLIFETMLYPFFDGSKEIIIPIRGVSHELAIEDPKTNIEIRGMSINGSWTSTTPSTGAGNMWCVVFGTSNYIYAGSEKLDYPPMECRCFMLGSEKETTPDAFKVGVMDYGWRVAYCMDGNSTQTDIATCTQTDDDFLEAMFYFADGQLGSTGKLIVVVGCHGQKYAGKHHTMTGKSRCIIAWINTIKLSEYENMVDDITSDGTHILLWIGACHGDGLDSFSSSDHNYNLESWSYRETHASRYIEGSCTYLTFTWRNHIEGPWNDPYVVPECEMAFFFLAAYEGTCEVTVSEVGEDIQVWYKAEFDDPEENCEMYIQKEWGTHLFYVNWGY